jgi:hypothetical protein
MVIEVWNDDDQKIVPRFLNIKEAVDRRLQV